MNVRSLLPFAALAAACAGSPAVPPSAPAQTPADFFPLSIGNEWVYRDESPALPAERRGAERTVRILDRTADGYFRDNERGELRADPDCVHDRSRRLLCAPIEKGRSWSSVVSVSSTERYEIAGVGEAVETPAGKFQGCVRVRGHNRASPGTEHVLEITYAPGVGPVRLETFAVVYANYLRFMEAGRNEHIRACGLRYRDFEERYGLRLPVAEATVSYRAPARYDDLLAIETTIAEVGRASARFEYRIRRGEELLATGHTVHACVDLDGRIRRMPLELVERLGGTAPSR